MRWIALSAALGMSACTTPVETSGLCDGLQRPVAALRSALAYETSTTPQSVGEAGTDVVLASEAGCAW
ncbi:hypothetical protein [Chachezhania antarctica]|uniref:hypothetical protein n=1 Tax=Chachezhania antarctica TaxID=2340860 RepID=UPI0013CEBDD2|nr:hypothetical protein [Chachezhania antarctica]